MTLFGLLLYFPLLVGVVCCLIGLAAIFKPQFMSTKFGIPASGTALHYVVATGVRDIFMGLTILVLFFYHSWIFVGFIHLFIGLVAASDFLLVRKHGDKFISLTHLTGAVFATAYGVWILFFL